MTTAILYGLLGGSTLFIGALLGIYLNIPKFIRGAIMAFGSGVLISALTFDLMETAFIAGGLLNASIGFISGTLLFVLGDYFIDKLGGHNRKHKHGKVYAEKNLLKKEDNAGTAIFLGAILDGIPESIAIGIGLAVGNDIGLSMMIAVLLSNLPEGLSGAYGMKSADKSTFYIILVWAMTLITSISAVVLGYVFLGNASENVLGVTLAVSAGAILAMIADTMIPEAFEEGGRFVAFATAFGFFLAFIVTHVA